MMEASVNFFLISKGSLPIVCFYLILVSFFQDQCGKISWFVIGLIPQTFLEYIKKKVSIRFCNVST